MDPEGQYLHILMLPWLAHGHVCPFLELAKRLSHENTVVHLCSTPVNLSSIREGGELNPEAFPSVKLVELQLPDLPGLPPHLHTTKHLPPHLMPALKTAFDLAEPAFDRLLQELRPDLLIYDFLQPWAPRAAGRRDIPAVLYLTTGAASTAFFCHHLKVPRDQDFPFPGMGCGGSPQEDADYCEQLLVKRVAHGRSDGDRVLECIGRSSGFVAIRSFTEMEGKYLDYLASLAGKEFVPVGPLVPDTLDEGMAKYKMVSEWLGRRRNVVFASFGTEYFLSKKEVAEVAHGLELSGADFIWVVRLPKPAVTAPAEEESNMMKMMPEGFAERVGERGLVLEGWAPQREILSHAGVGAFVTHCGWSSVMEGMKLGVPMVALPLQLDQPLNARLVVELGVGVEVRPEKGPPQIRGERLAEGIRDVFADEGVRRKAKDMADLLGRKGSAELQVLVGRLSLLATRGADRERIKSLPDIVSD